LTISIEQNISESVVTIMVVVLTLQAKIQLRLYNFQNLLERHPRFPKFHFNALSLNGIQQILMGKNIKCISYYEKNSRYFTSPFLNLSCENPLAFLNTEFCATMENLVLVFA
jgi:hypothetical protein